jgi:Peptidase M66
MKSVIDCCVRASVGLVSMVVFLLTSVYSTASHELGNGLHDLTPPMVKEAEETAALRQDFGNGAPVLRGVFNDMKLWPAGTNLQGCFYDRDRILKAFFVQIALTWLSGTSLKVNFGKADTGYRGYRNSASQDIRVTFGRKGYWSYIGTDSIHPDVIAEGPSLNVQTDGLPFEKLNRQVLDEKILHEFGHALGLPHEHQSPESHCGAEFDWPKILDYGQRTWGWDQAKIKYNFEQYTSVPRLSTTA